MNTNLKKYNRISEYKRDIVSKFQFYKLEIKEEIGKQKIKEFMEVSRFRKMLKILKFFLIIILAIISSFVTLSSLFFKTDNSKAMESYQKGIIYLEDDDFEQAQQCFKEVYEINNDLLDIKFYYAYTEYFLENYDRSYQILKENRNTLSEDELAFYAMYEYSKENYKKSREYLNKITKPENLEIISFAHYIITSIELGFHNSYNEGISTFYANVVLLEAKINEAKQLPDAERIFHVETDDTEHSEIEAASAVVERINTNTLNDVLQLKRCKLIAYMQFITHSIQHGEYTLPVYVFEDAAESVDFLTNYHVSRKYIEALFFFSNAAVFNYRPKEIERAYKIVVEKYQQLKLLEKQEGKTIFEKDDRENLDACEAILSDLQNNCLDSKLSNYKFNLSSFGVTDENYEMEKIVKWWAENFLEALYIKSLL